MAFVLFGSFNGYCGWQSKIIEVCQQFYEKYDRFPNFIRMKEATMDALFDEQDAAFQNPYSEEHAVKDSHGNLLIPLRIDDENNAIKYPENLSKSDRMFFEEDWKDFCSDEDDYGCSDFTWEDFEERIIETSGEEDDDTIYPVYFGPNDDCTVSFITNKFELKFLEGEKLPLDYFIVQFGDGPEGGGEDCEEDNFEEQPQIKRLAA